MRHNHSSLTYATPSPITALAPWKLLSGAEVNAARLVYDSYIAPKHDSGLPDLGTVAETGDDYVLSPRPSLYADGNAATVENWYESLQRAIGPSHPGAELALKRAGIVVKGMNRESLQDFLRSTSAIAFREAPYSDAIDSNPSTSGRFSIGAASNGGLVLRRNPYHPCPPKLTTLRISHITAPEALREGFGTGKFDVIVVSGDEQDILEGRDARLRAGEICRTPANTVSMLSAQPGGALANDALRQAIAAAMPREEFHEAYVGDNGRPAFGFSAASRERPFSSAGHATESRQPRPSQITFVVPPSERTVHRAHWLASTLWHRTGVRVRVHAPSWPEYWRALRDPASGDLLWSGISVDEDEPRHWVRYNLFGPSLPLAARYGSLKDRVWSADCSDLELILAERTLIDDGWIMPLYHHYQTYLVRSGLRGLRIDPGDWPLPGVHYCDRLAWS